MGMASFLALAVSGCGSSDHPVSGEFSLVPGHPQELVLGYGQEAAVRGTVLRVSFGQVLSDSRCPVDVVCVWQGNAEVELGIRAGMGPTHPLRLNTSLDPRYADWMGVRITLLELKPAPRSDTQIKPEDYTVRLRVEALP